MGKNSKIPQKSIYIILAAIGVLAFNLLLSVPLANVTPDKQGMQTTSWNEILIFARPFSIALYVFFLLSLFEKTARVGKKMISFLMAHSDVIFLCVVLGYLALYEIYAAYCASYGISPDSIWYMREAASLLAGNGFYVDKLAGYDTWFANWPIGYPALIALSAFISRRSIYLSSKLLSIALVGLGFIVLRLKFKKDAWIFSLIYFNAGFLELYRFTWSENPFILCLIIWGMALSAVVENPKPRKRWYVITTLGILGAFFTRYFGIVTILFTFLCLLLYIAYYFIKGRDLSVLSKIKGLLCVEIVSSVIVASYLFINRMMAGNMSGVDRQEWWDHYSDLIKNLYDALAAEILNAVRVDIGWLMPYTNSGRAAVVLLLLSVLAVLLMKAYQKEKKVDYKTIFIGFGIFYYFVFTFVRFHSSMDPFGFRFFAPAGMMVSIGVLGFVKDHFGDRLKTIQVVICLFLCISGGYLFRHTKSYTVETRAYGILYREATATTSVIPSKGIILNYGKIESLRAFRPDIRTDGMILGDDTMETIIQRYDKSESIWIQNYELLSIVNEGRYSEELRTELSRYVVDGMGDNEYIRIH